MPKLFNLGQLDSDELEKGIVSGADDGKPLESRDLSWDRIIYFLSGLLLALASLDLFSSLIQGGGNVACDLGGLGGSDANFILGVCERSIPATQYFPAVLLAQSIVILLPHFIWRSQFNGHFVSFFGKAKSLEQNVGLGVYSYRNKNIIRQLKTTFVTYNQSVIFFWYKAKLVLQLLVIAGSVVVVTVVDDITNFEDTFNCSRPEGIDWPLPNDATPTCIFTSLRLFQLILVFDLILLFLMFPNLLWGLIWCFKRHPNILGSKTIAKFSFSTGLPQELYIPKPVLSGLIGQCYKGARELYEEFRNRFILPSIENDFDFLVILLSSVDVGLGNTFREGEVILELEKLYQADQQDLNAHVHHHKSVDESTSGYDEPSKLGWQFMNGVYDKDFQRVGFDEKLVIPRNIRGAVIGYGLLCEGIRYKEHGNTKLPLAVEFTFGTQGYALSLARVFRKVFSINFDPGFYLESEAADSGEEKPGVLITDNPSLTVTTIRCPDNIYTKTMEMSFNPDQAQTPSQKAYSQLNQALGRITKFIERPPKVFGTRKIEFILITPIMFQKHCRVVDRLLQHLEKNLNEETILLIMKPTQIEDYDINDLFFKWTPENDLLDGKCFEPIKLDVALCEDILDWLPRDISSATDRKKKNPHLLQLQCGESTCMVEMATYRIVKTE